MGRLIFGYFMLRWLRTKERKCSMFREMLIQHGENETDRDLLAATLNSLTGEYLSDYFEAVGEYTMVTRIPHRLDPHTIKTRVESLGFIVCSSLNQTRADTMKLSMKTPMPKEGLVLKYKTNLWQDSTLNEELNGKPVRKWVTNLISLPAYPPSTQGIHTP